MGSRLLRVVVLALAFSLAGFVVPAPPEASAQPTCTEVAEARRAFAEVMRTYANAPPEVRAIADQAVRDASRGQFRSIPDLQRLIDACERGLPPVPQVVTPRPRTPAPTPRPPTVRPATPQIARPATPGPGPVLYGRPNLDDKAAAAIQAKEIARRAADTAEAVCAAGRLTTASREALERFDRNSPAQRLAKSRSDVEADLADYREARDAAATEAMTEGLDLALGHFADRAENVTSLPLRAPRPGNMDAYARAARGLVQAEELTGVVEHGQAGATIATFVSDGRSLGERSGKEWSEFGSAVRTAACTYRALSSGACTVIGGGAMLTSLAEAAGYQRLAARHDAVLKQVTDAQAYVDFKRRQLELRAAQDADTQRYFSGQWDARRAEADAARARGVSAPALPAKPACP